MDYEEEQANEIEALQSIYFDHFIDRTPEGGKPHSFQLHIYPHTVETEDDVNYVGLSMDVTLPETYPEVLPQLTLFNSKGLTSVQLQELKDILMEMAEGYLGTVMVFALASEAQQWLLEHNDQRSEEQLAQKSEEELKDLKKREESEFLRSVDRFTKDSEVGLIHAGGTPVTIDNFTEWKVNFDEELAERAKPEKKSVAVAAQQQKEKPTGRQYFEEKARRYLETISEKKEDGAEESANVEFDEDLFLDEDNEEEEESSDGE